MSSPPDSAPKSAPAPEAAAPPTSAPPTIAPPSVAPPVLDPAGPTAWRLWPVAVALGLFSILTWSQFQTATISGEGAFVYALDDAYIHMAMARCFARDGVWGLTTEGFAGASSSPLWVAVLALGWKVAGDVVLLPLLLNVVGAAALLAAVHRLWSREGLPQEWSAAGLAAIVLAAPLPTLALAGMEHVWHHFLLVLWWGELRPLWAERREGAPAPAPSGRLWILTALLPLVRLESAFLIAAASAMLLWPPRPQWKTAFLLAAVGASCFAAFGWWSTTQGGTFLPSSILLKGDSGGLNPAQWFTGERLNKLTRIVTARPELPLCVIWTAAVAARAAGIHDARRRRRLSEAGILLLTAAAHAQFATFGWLFRYESYWVVLTLVYAIPPTCEWWAARTAPDPSRKEGEGLLVGAAMLLAATGLLDRATYALTAAGFASRNIYEQQVQAARFLGTYYPEADVAALDVGAIAYFNPRIKILDLYGLATQEVADLRRAKRYTSEALQALAARRKVPVAVSIARWPGVLEEVPGAWVKVGTWTIAQPVVSGEASISFYAVDPAEAPRLIEHLREFAPKLPVAVRPSGLYTRPGAAAELLALPPPQAPTPSKP